MAAALLAAGLAAVVFSVCTVQQETAWKDEFTVFSVAHQYAPHNQVVAKDLARANVQIALHGLDEGGRCEDAVPTFERVSRQYPEE